MTLIFFYFNLMIEVKFMFIDTHCHISNKYYNNIEDIINECLSNKVNQMILSCCEKDDIDESLQLIDTLLDSLIFLPTTGLSVLG